MESSTLEAPEWCSGSHTWLQSEGRDTCAKDSPCQNTDTQDKTLCQRAVRRWGSVRRERCPGQRTSPRSPGPAAGASPLWEDSASGSLLWEDSALGSLLWEDSALGFKSVLKGISSTHKLLHMEGNHQQDEKTTYRMGEVLATCNLIRGINTPNQWRTHIIQHQKHHHPYQKQKSN